MNAEAAPRKRRFLVITAWVLWGAASAVAVVFIWRGGAAGGTPRGVTRIMYGLALLLLTPYIPLRALAGWRCRRAVGRLAEGWKSGAAELPNWPGVRERAGVLTMRCGGSSFRPWALALGLGLSGYCFEHLSREEGALSYFRLMLSLAPALCAVLISLLWGPSGWLLTVDAARSRAILLLWRVLRRFHVSDASLPTIQGVSLPELRGGSYRGILVGRATGADWKLGIPGNWPAQLVEALAARMASLAGVKFGRTEEDAGTAEESSQEATEVPVEEAAE